MGYRTLLTILIRRIPDKQLLLYQLDRSVESSAGERRILRYPREKFSQSGERRIVCCASPYLERPVATISLGDTFLPEPFWSSVKWSLC
jgi:hypothetical protein